MCKSTMLVFWNATSQTYFNAWEEYSLHQRKLFQSVLIVGNKLILQKFNKIQLLITNT